MTVQHDVHISNTFVASSPLPVTDTDNHKLTGHGMIHHFISKLELHFMLPSLPLIVVPAVIETELLIAVIANDRA